FKPTLTNEGVIVKWGTNSQWDSDHFIIEKSKNGIDWEYVNEVPSKNGKFSYKEFSITDPNPYEGDSYYRLVEVDVNGKRTVYSTDFIRNDKTFSGFSIYPNPSNGSFVVSISGDSPQYQLNLFDVLGKSIGVYTLLAGKNEISTALSSGMYLAKLKVGHDYFTQKIVVK
ncbi:MAG: T9SS type A sorting domain-containing protein, partial [Opitutaceae bacterium]|nr:T9SS type A sorting domain-containing protein [Cytophagales bacterium]